MIRPETPARRPEAGFTLIELIISIAILGIVFSAVSLAMLGALRANGETKDRLDETRDAQFASAYFAGDVAGATEMSAGGPAGCLPAGSPATDAVAELRGTSFDTAIPPNTTKTAASYVFTTSTVDGVATGRLTRFVCEAPEAAGSYGEPTRTTIVARTLAATFDPVACSPSPCSATSSSMTLTLDQLSGDGPIVLSGTSRTTEGEAP